MATTLTMTRGDTFTWTATIGAPTNLTGSTLWFTVKRARDVATDVNDALALVKSSWVSGGASAGITVAAPTTGVAVITIPSAVTATFDARLTYAFDLKMQDTGGSITTLDIGTISVIDQVSERTTTP